jgi:V-ATPase subunit H
VLHKLLHENYHDMTRWDVYKSEVESGHLQWGIVHTEKFFKENAMKMEGSDGNFAIVKVRRSLLHIYLRRVSVGWCRVLTSCLCYII